MPGILRTHRRAGRGGGRHRRRLFAAEIAEASYRQQQEIDSAERVVVGVNAFVSDFPEVPVQTVDKAVEETQAQRLATVRAERDPARAEAALRSLREAAAAGRNTMPAFMEAAHAYVTLGEQMDVLKEVFGVYEEPVLI